MSEAREQMLAAIRDALRDRAQLTGASGAAGEEPSVPAPPAAAEALVALFIERLRDYGATVTECAPADVGEAVRGACERHGARRLLVPAGLAQHWRPDGVELVTDDGLAAEQLDAVGGVLTGAALGIAQTGTIALDAGADQGRRALTLIPDLHVCVLEAGRVVASLPEALALLAPAIQPGGRAITLISGPSATADIELRRVQGVHGPRRLEVIIAGA